MQTRPMLPALRSTSGIHRRTYRTYRTRVRTGTARSTTGEPACSATLQPMRLSCQLRPCQPNHPCIPWLRLPCHADPWDLGPYREEDLRHPTGSCLFISPLHVQEPRDQRVPPLPMSCDHLFHLDQHHHHHQHALIMDQLKHLTSLSARSLLPTRIMPRASRLP